jgi:II/X family phage/plasmid replication protein
MLKVYIKSLEMESHGISSGRAYEYARDNGIIRLELELKRRELHDLGWSDFNEFLKGWEMGTVHKLFADYEKILEVTGVQNDADFLDSLPIRLRSIAALFLSGRDVRSCVSRATFFRYRKSLLDYGIDIADERPAMLQTLVRTVEIHPVSAPDWYWKAA